MSDRGLVVLEDGSVYWGRSVAAPGIAFGEAVFTTGMTGYQEVATDPSFAEQIVCFTAPMIGNYGISDTRLESDRVAAKGIVMRRVGGLEWCRWLADRGVIALDGIDTRSLVLKLRGRGAMRATIAAGDHEPGQLLARVRTQPEMAGRALVAGVSCREPYEAGSGRTRVVLVDYGTKRSIVRRLVAAGAHVTVVPYDTPAEGILERRPDGVLLSNGPGDPGALPDQVEAVRGLLGRVPILGICLGHQLLGLALGYRTSKLPFGHRGANHPVQDLRTGRVLVTSQNHGFVVEAEGPEVRHVSLYDGTVEGLELPSEGIRSVQFHPEAGPGPHDAWPIIERWVEEVSTLAKAA